MWGNCSPGITCLPPLSQVHQALPERWARIVLRCAGANLEALPCLEKHLPGELVRAELGPLHISSSSAEHVQERKGLILIWANGSSPLTLLSCASLHQWGIWPKVATRE